MLQPEDLESARGFDSHKLRMLLPKDSRAHLFVGEDPTKALFHSFDGAIPVTGDRVTWASVDATVLCHFHHANYLGVWIACDEAPTWANEDQRKHAATSYSPYVVPVFGAELTGITRNQEEAPSE